MSLSSLRFKWTFAFFVGDKPSIRKLRLSYSRFFKLHTWTCPDFCVFPSALERDKWIDSHLPSRVRVTYLSVTDKQFERMRTTWQKKEA